MKIIDLYKYSWFSTLSYVKWSKADGIENDPRETEPRFLITAAAEDRLPGESGGSGDTKADTLGEKIFYPTARGGLSWQLAG